MNSITNKIIAAFFIGALAGALLYTPDCRAQLLKETIGSETNWVLYKQVKFAYEGYLPLIHKLNDAKEGETVRIILRKNGGGAVPTMDLIAKAMVASKAKVITSVQGWAASAAAHILMHGDEVIIPPDARILWHTGSISFDGKKRIRITPDLQPWYFYAVNKQMYVYPLVKSACKEGPCISLEGVKITLPTLDTNLGTVVWKKHTINPDGKYRYVSKEYYKFFLTGGDKVVTGKTVCSWNLDQYPKRDAREHYIGEGCKLVGVKGQRR